MKSLRFTIFILSLMLTFWASGKIYGQCPNNDPSSPVGIVPVTMDFPGGPPQCGPESYGSFRKDDPPPSGISTYLLDGAAGVLTLNINPSGSCGSTLVWSVSDNIVVDRFVAKGGTGGQNVYNYTGVNPRPTTDGNIHCPVTGGSGKYADFSHVDVCFHYRLSASKTAVTSYTRDYDWNLVKSCDGPNPLGPLTTGQTYSYPFHWTASVSGFTDSDWKVTGVITVANSTLTPAVITSIADVLSCGGVSPTLSCGTTFPYTLAAGATLTCNYTANLAAPCNGTNTVTVATSSPLVEGDVATANYHFGAPTSLIDECITVTDNCTTTTNVCIADAPKTVNYTCPISYAECGTFTYSNTASYATNDDDNDTDESGSSACTVAVNVPCQGGCTLTIGYWKTHSEFGPAPYDNTWAQLSNGASTTFFLSGTSYYNVAWTAPAGNAYYIMAHQYIAAKLNKLNGASVPAAVQTAYNSATTLLNTYTPAQIAGLAGNNALRKQFVNMATILENYNSGLTGPGHCAEGSGIGSQGVNDRTSINLIGGNDFLLYPNPATDEVNIDLSSYVSRPVVLTIYNQLGSVVLSRVIEEVQNAVITLQFDKGSMASGIYLVSLQSEGTRHTKMLSVQK
ncbi:MAG: T9SS type A sorting domain-containing protein [Saprospiraceae bacterium]